MSKVKMGLTGLTATELVAYAQSIHDKMNGNANFPTPAPSLADLQTAIDTLAAANAAVDANGGRTEHLNRTNAVNALKNLLRSMSGYVQATSDGDGDIILSSGFEVVRRATRIGKLPAPIDLLAKLTDFHGQVRLNWSPVHGAHLYQVYMNPTDPNDEGAWVSVGSITKSEYLVEGLETGRFYWFRVNAIGTAGESPMSDAAQSLAA